jgi:hypothetical protein
MIERKRSPRLLLTTKNTFHLLNLRFARFLGLPLRRGHAVQSFAMPQEVPVKYEHLGNGDPREGQTFDDVASWLRSQRKEFRGKHKKKRD